MLTILIFLSIANAQLTSQERLAAEKLYTEKLGRINQELVALAGNSGCSAANDCVDIEVWADQDSCNWSYYPMNRSAITGAEKLLAEKSEASRGLYFAKNEKEQPLSSCGVFIERPKVGCLIPKGATQGKCLQQTFSQRLFDRCPPGTLPQASAGPQDARKCSVDNRNFDFLESKLESEEEKRQRRKEERKRELEREIRQDLDRMKSKFITDDDSEPPSKVIRMGR